MGKKSERERKKREKEVRKAEMRRRSDRIEFEQKLFSHLTSLDGLLKYVGLSLKELMRNTNEEAYRAVTMLPMIDDVLTYLSLSERATAMDVDMRAFNDAVIGGSMEAYPGLCIADGDFLPDRWSQSVIFSSSSGGLLTGDRVETVSSQEAALVLDPGAVAVAVAAGQRFYKIIHADVDRNGRLVSRTIYFRRGQDIGSRFVFMSRRGVSAIADTPDSYADLRHSTHRIRQVGLPGGEEGEAIAASCGVVTLIHGYLRRTWSVRFSYDGVFGVRLPCNAASVKSMFCHRDVPEGYTRRRALLHWVCQHWRTTPSSPEDEAYVREHLRGTVDFDWFGFKCRLYAPAEVARNEALKEARAAMPREETRRKKASAELEITGEKQ